MPMKRFFSIAAILGAAALTGSVMLASTTVAQPCPFSKNKGITTTTSGDSPTLSSTNTNTNNLGIVGAGVAAVAGLFVVGIVYKVRRAGQEANAALAEFRQEESLEAASFPIPIPSEALFGSTSEPEISDPTSEKDKDLTLVG